MEAFSRRNKTFQTRRIFFIYHISAISHRAVTVYLLHANGA